MAAGDIFKTIKGVMGQFFKIGGPAGARLTHNSGVIEANDSAGTSKALLRGAYIPSSGETLYDIVALLDLKGRVAQIQFSFDGASAPSPNANLAKFGFCHTTGGGYTAGQIVYDDGSALVLIPAVVCRHLTTTAVVTGTISLIANGFYGQDATNTWTLKGDGGSSNTGQVLNIELAFAFGDTGGVSSTAAIPSGARVLRTRVIVDTAFNNTPTVAVIIDGSGPEALMATADSVLTTTGEYVREDIHDIVAGTTGKVKATVGGTPDVGVGSVIVEYVTPNA